MILELKKNYPLLFDTNVIVLMIFMRNILYWGDIVGISVNIENKKLRNFTSKAQDTLKIQLEKYANEIITESNSIEETFREKDAYTEITSDHVLQAVRKFKIHRPRKKGKRIIVIKLIAFVFSFIAGGLFDFDEMQRSKSRLIWFIVVFLIALCVTFIQFSVEAED